MCICVRCFEWIMVYVCFCSSSIRRSTRSNQDSIRSSLRRGSNSRGWPSKQPSIPCPSSAGVAEAPVGPEEDRSTFVAGEEDRSCRLGDRSSAEGTGAEDRLGSTLGWTFLLIAFRISLYLLLLWCKSFSLSKRRKKTTRIE